MGMAAILVMCQNHLNKLSSPIPQKLHMKYDFDPAVSEEMFKECRRRTTTTDEGTTEAYLSYKLTSEPSAQVS